MIETAPFGRTGHQSTRTIFGAAALGSVTQEQADQTMALLQQYGVNHIDVAASYGDAELRLAPWLKEHRKEVFLATKTGARDRDGATEELHRSLERMGVDSVDLWQFHNLADVIEWDQALSRGGAIEAALQAREQGLVKHIGVTGHGSQIPAVHFRSLERVDFDSVLLPYNFIMMQDPNYAEAFERLVARCQERNVAVQTIKSIARRPWWGQEHTRSTWYEPLEEQADIDRAVHWVLGRPNVFLNTVGDISLLPRVLDAASRVAPRPDDAEMRADQQRVDAVPLFV